MRLLFVLYLRGKKMCVSDWMLLASIKNYYIHRFFEIRDIKDYWKSELFCGHKTIHDPKLSNDYLRELIVSGKHYFVSRVGTIEANAMLCGDMYRRKTILGIPKSISLSAQVQAGMFSNDNHGIVRFFEIYKESLSVVTDYAYWQTDGGKRIVKRWLNPSATIISFDSLKALGNERPYFESFKGKKVLIVSPFYRSIESQYKKRELLFEKKFLPDFTLLTYCPVMTYGDCKSVYPTWEAALMHMYDEISQIQCDVVTLSCGAYGLPLGAMLYRKGYNVIHVGGMTQCWFGIAGKAYDRDPSISSLMNENWVRPSKEETPPGAHKIEGGNYW